MITLRCTKKLQKHLGARPEVEDREPSSPLGDWYGNLVEMPQGTPLVLISNERTMLSVVMAQDADVLTEFKQRVIALLRRLNLPAETIERETFHLQQIRIGKTKSRRVLGSMNDAALQAEVRLFAEPCQTFEQVEDALARNLYSMLDYARPSELARELLAAPPAVTRTTAPEKASQPECSDVEAASSARSGPASRSAKKRSAGKRSKKANKGRAKKANKGSTRTDGRRCGLCGKRGKPFRTPCCGNWICDDYDSYQLFSYARNSCHRNHERYTVCSVHFMEGHKGEDWRTCQECREYFSELEMYVWSATNDYNFVKLENPPAYEPTRCAKCKGVIDLGEDGYSIKAGDYFCTACSAASF